MAKIGLRYPVAAFFATEEYGKIPTYKDGFVIGKAVAADKQINSNDNPLYADDAIAENDTSFSDGTIALTVSDFGTDVANSLEVRAKMLGHELTSVDNGATILRKRRDDNAPKLGLGYFSTKKMNNVNVFEATWMYKTKFQLPSETANTKGQSIEWQTPQITGKIMFVEGMENIYEETAIFTSASQATEWLRKKAGLDATVDKTTLTNTITTAEGKTAEEYTSVSYAEMYVVLLEAKAVKDNAYAGQADVDAANAKLEEAVLALEERA